MDTDINAKVAAHSVAFIGAVNWGLQETNNMDLVQELLGSGNAGIAYVVIGAAGLISLTDQFDVTDILDED